MKYLIGLCILTCSLVPAFGATITVDFSQATGDIGATHSYAGSPSGSINATAYGTGSPHLYGKNGGGDENGVGLTTDSDHEITAGHFIQLDVTSLIGTTLTITMGSTTDGEIWSIFGSNSALATSGSGGQTGTTESSFTYTPTLKYLDFTSANGNVLLSTISYTQTTTPEPSTFGIVGLGGVLIGLLRRKFARS